MATEEIAALPIELRETPPTSNSIHHPRADEIGPRAAEPAGQMDDPDALCHIIPSAIANAHAVGELQPVGFGRQFDPGDLLPVFLPVWSRRDPARPQPRGVVVREHLG
jgi:hypothetical protein